ncbi:MAG: hypothetical protein ABI723_18635 [Bacteroidia bacterium]
MATKINFIPRNENSLFRESNGNDYTISNETNYRTDDRVVDAILSLCIYLKCQYEITNRVTLEINVRSNNSVYKVRSFSTKFIKDGYYFELDASTPLNKYQPRYYKDPSFNMFQTKYRRRLWTDIKTIKGLDINADLLFNILAKNHKLVYNHLKENGKNIHNMSEVIAEFDEIKLGEKFGEEIIKKLFTNE